MSPPVELVPLKRVLKLCNVSRATLWRVSRSGAEGFPTATKKGGRLYWLADEIDAVKRAIEGFEGRTAFDRKRKNRLRRTEARYQSLAAMKQAKIQGRRVRVPARGHKQDDLFSG